MKHIMAVGEYTNSLNETSNNGYVVKMTQSKVLPFFNEYGRIYKKDLVELCRKNGISRNEYENDIRTLLQKDIISSHEVLVDWIDYEVTLFICNYEILGCDGDIVHFGKRKYGE